MSEKDLVFVSRIDGVLKIIADGLSEDFRELYNYLIINDPALFSDIKYRKLNAILNVLGTDIDNLNIYIVNADAKKIEIHRTVDDDRNGVGVGASAFVDVNNPHGITNNWLDGKAYPELWKNISSQDPAEFQAFLDYLKPLNIKTVLEIGTERGGTILGLDSIVNDGVLVCCDTDDLTATLNKLPFRNMHHFVRGDSTDKFTHNNIVSMLPHYDVAFIDGNHATEFVKKDFDFCKTIADIVALHDIELDTIKPFWEELKSKYKTTEFNFHNSMIDKNAKVGIGVVLING
jgi:hypothetical protein